MPLISQLNIGKRAKSFLENVLEQHDPSLEKTVENAAPLVNVKMFKAAPNLGRVSERELKALLQPYWNCGKIMESEPSAKTEATFPPSPTETAVAPYSPPPPEYPISPPSAVMQPVSFRPSLEQRQAVLSTWTSPAETYPPKPTMRSSALNSLLICPRRLAYMQYELEQEHEHGNAFTGVGQMGHKYIGTMLLTGGNEREALKAFDREKIGDLTIEQMREFWRYLSTDDRLPCVDAAKTPSGCRVIIEAPMSMKIGGIEITGHTDYAYVHFAEKYGMVCDWKFYHVPDELPPIAEDYQMLAYALQLRNAYNLNHVVVRRFLGYQCRYDEIYLGPEEISIGIEALGEIVDEIWRRRNEARIGHQCHSCFQQTICTTYQRHLETTAATTPLVQFDVHQFNFSTDEDVRDFLIAAKALEGIVKQGMEAAKLYIRRTKRTVYDPVSRREWGINESSRAKIVDTRRAASILKSHLPQDKIWEIVSMSKQAIETALIQAHVKKEDRNHIFKALFQNGAMESKPVESYEWRNVQVDSEKMHEYSTAIKQEIQQLTMMSDLANPALP